MYLKERPQVARDLHKKFYTALAAGDVGTINEIACAGLQRHAKLQIAQRTAAKVLPGKFEIEKYIGFSYPQWLRWPLVTFLPFQSTKILMDKASPLQMGKDTTMRQCVARVKSRQSLDRGDGKPPRVADLTEYVVIQKLKINGVEQPWKIWGTVQRSTMEEIHEWLEKKAEAATSREGIWERASTAARSMASGQ